MTLTRWKLMAGTLAVSLGGLAAVAEQPAPSIDVPVPPAPILVPVPTVAELPVPVPALSPTFPAEPAEKCDTDCPLKRSQVAERLPSPRVVADSPAVPEMPEPTPVFDGAPVVRVASAEPAPTPIPAPVVQPLSTPTPTPMADLNRKKLRVLLNMGEDRPRFEVKDEEETLLRLVSDKVDVKCPSDRGEALPTMRAVGSVTFYTPGGEGVCDELTLTPGTGDVVVAGNVRFKYHWGKVETEVSGERMTFRLGAGPGLSAVSTPSTRGAIPASFVAQP